MEVSNKVGSLNWYNSEAKFIKKKHPPTNVNISVWKMYSKKT